MLLHSKIPKSFISLRGVAVLERFNSILQQVRHSPYMSVVLRWINNMENTSVKQGIKNSWSLISFAKAHGKMQVGEFANSESGELFKSCIFTNPEDNSRTFVAFSSNLGVLTPSEIAARKDDLQVVQLESGNYSLCKVGQNNWKDVDLGL